MVFAVPFSLHNLFLGLTSAASTYIVIRFFYNLFLSPLSTIPGPWYAAVSDLWLNFNVVRLRQCRTVQELFEMYGPVVRVGPNKIVFRDISTMRSIYCVHKFDKGSYYKCLCTNNNDHAMTTLDHAHHLTRRRGYAPHYTPANVAKFQPEMHESMCEVLSVLDNIAGKASTECLALFRHLMVDVMVSSSYGYRLGAVTKWAMDVEDPLSTAINDFPKRGTFRSIIPSWAWKLVCRFPNARWKQMCDSDKIMAQFVSSRVYEMRAQMNAGKISESEKIPMLQRLLQYRYSSEEPMPDHDIISECMGHLIAGSDTSSISLSFLFWELSRRPEILKKLQAELDEAMPDPRTIPDISVLQELPYLNAFIKEGLRVYSAVPGLLERVVPNSTTKSGDQDEIFDLMGYALPPGTIVSTQAWSVQRDSTIFPSPDTFLPERWLECSQAELVTMNQHMMPFGTGTRVCGGKTLAQVMLRITTAAVVRNFNIAAPVETNERSMEIKDSFVIFPASMECKLIFLPRN
ncbi:hypothetical protein D9756_000128 [Leucocoprinus leucothites]|uniref:Cytochrome P450 n=1 Tax=Leucocoprinus leucothites TaxID=201217 RepID=A0A8H5GFE3_9AGAR|nr:hypothetical protein D9756_000128 [Leucoagaricus leucothites]